MYTRSHTQTHKHTQSKHLFKRKVRAYSHGCVRLSKPVDMLNHLSSNYTSHTDEDVKTKYDSLKTHHLALDRELYVHTAYLTSYVDDLGRLHRFKDIYKFDTYQKLNF